MMSETEFDDFHNEFKPLNVNKQRKKRHRLNHPMLVHLMFLNEENQFKSNR